MTRRHAAWVAGIALAMAALSGCESSPDTPDIAGVWIADDGSGTKTIGADGRCTGMYYNSGAPLDIGGGMTCTLGSTASASGTYTLVVEQPPNQATYAVTFDDADTMRFTSGGTTITLQRQ